MPEAFKKKSYLKHEQTQASVHKYIITSCLKDLWELKDSLSFSKSFEAFASFIKTYEIFSDKVESQVGGQEFKKNK